MLEVLLRIRLRMQRSLPQYNNTVQLHFRYVLWDYCSRLEASSSTASVTNIAPQQLSDPPTVPRETSSHETDWQEYCEYTPPLALHAALIPVIVSDTVAIEAVRIIYNNLKML